MTELPTIECEVTVRLGPGRLIAVVGPSGAGKDTLINLAREACADDPSVIFPRRVVTRDASRFEDNETISEPAFQEAIQRDAFAIHWQAHGHCYGVPRAIDAEIRAGHHVVVNVSRTVLAALRSTYADVTVVLVTAPAEILAQRLAGRDRGSDGPLAHRLGRAVDAADFDVVIDNIGSPEQHACELVQAIRRA